MELVFMAIYVTFSLFLYVIIDFKLKKKEILADEKYKDRLDILESGLNTLQYDLMRLGDDHKRSFMRIESELHYIKNKPL